MMEAATLTTRSVTGRSSAGSPLLRLQPDERLVTLTRRGDQAAFETLVSRYQSKLLGFCRHMLSNREDAEDVLQEVFAAAYTAMLADDRPIMVKPWFYRIARNRSLNHMRRAKAVGVDSMDIHVSEFGLSTADRVQRREDFLGVMEDISVLPETQRTALLLREIDGLPYEQIAEVMETTVPSVKSLLVRARVALAEMTEARGLTCNEVRIELGEIAEGITRRMSPAVRRHVKSCESCKDFKAQLTATDAALAAMAPVGLIIAAKNIFVSHFGLGSGSSAAGNSMGIGASGAAAGGSAGASIASTISAGTSIVASKAAASIAAAALVTAGAVQVEQSVVRAPAATIQAPAISLAKPVPTAIKRDALASIAVPAAEAAPEVIVTEAPAEQAAPTVAAAVEAPAPPVEQPAAPATDGGETITINSGADVSLADGGTDSETAGIAPEAPAEEPAATEAASGGETSAEAPVADPSAEAPVEAPAAS